METSYNQWLDNGETTVQWLLSNLSNSARHKFCETVVCENLICDAQ